MADAPLLVFDILGTMAHFRKFYSNTSSLTYSLPPRTTVVGLIAGILGLDRSSYPIRLSLEQARVGVGLEAPVRRVVHTVGYLATDSDDWHGVKLRTQVPVELLLPQEPHPTLRYRVYFTHRDADLVTELHRRLTQQRYCYPPCLGPAYCLAWVEGAQLIPWEEVETSSGLQGPVPMASAVLATHLDPSYGLPLAEGVRVLKDRMPLALGPGRELVAVGDVVWTEPARPTPGTPRWRVALRAPAYRWPGDDRWFVFLEGGT